ncbi:glycosyl hydrolase [Micractinium conductrix]|uniref:Glycosyl hydrolase n=1 Tax=Micractinium conductrix TaxID=554055 RepID=A0A2P6VL73_9CHLO|nr:glycosyl hydrolase [Micractinium conductrix]|eukprot:PSC74838.1 glycosyl hydrolase [Micractinium conductrix]
MAALRAPRSARARKLDSGVLMGVAIGLSLVLLWPQRGGSGATSAISYAASSVSGEASGWRGGGSWRVRPQVPPHLPIEVYARGPSQDQAATERVAALLSGNERKQLRELCGRTLYHSLQTGWVSHETGAWTFVATGDLPLMWIRDSAVQIGVLLPRLAKRPALRRVVEGAIRAQAFYITQDPYANGYEPEWQHPDKRHKGDRGLGRGGWVGVRNYELDSGAYYMNLLWNWYLTPGLYNPARLLDDPLIFEAANTLVDVWIREQRHNASSPYRYAELGNKGLGPSVGFTGMTWSGFRPSDDPSEFGFPVAANMYAAAGLERALELNRQIWRSAEFDAKASRLLQEIQTGIEQHGRVEVQGEKVYAYEVDGQGSSLTDFDDPNIPSLVSIPMLGYRGYDRRVYAATRRRLLDPKTNRYYFKGKHFKGMGSPHTSDRMAWALGIYTEVLTASSPEEQAEGLKLLLKLQCGDGLMHESVHVDDLNQCTRKWFEWANALLVVSVEQLLGYDCDAAAQAFHLGYVAAREEKDGGSNGDPRMHQTAEAAMQWDGVYKSKVADWKGIGHLVPIHTEGEAGSIKPVEVEGTT